MFKGEHQPVVKFVADKRIIGRVWIQFAPDQEIDELCVVDTGADMTTIPQRVWELFLDRSIVEKYPGKAPSGIGGKMKVRETKLHLALTGLGQTLPFELGQCDVWLAFDDDAGYQMKQVLLGIGGGTLSKGGICINWKQGRNVEYIEVNG